MNSDNSFEFELNLEKSFRKFSCLIPLTTILTGIFLISSIVICMQYFASGNCWTVIPAGLLSHAFFIVVIHDGAHKSITRTSSDRLIMNLGSALMLLPFYGEFFRKYHLIHHGNTNTEHDPLWPYFKKNLYENKRWFYILCECVPLLFTFYLVFQSDKQPQAGTKKQIKQPDVSSMYILFSTCITLAVVFETQPSLWFCLGTLFSLNIFSTLRHWCEHLGTDPNKSSNTFWFPLGMGIGNHDTHHHAPHISWVVLLVGLFYRKKTTNPLLTLHGVLFNKSFIHYKQSSE